MKEITVDYPLVFVRFPCDKGILLSCVLIVVVWFQITKHDGIRVLGRYVYGKIEEP